MLRALRVMSKVGLLMRGRHSDRGQLCLLHGVLGSLLYLLNRVHDRSGHLVSEL